MPKIDPHDLIPPPDHDRVDRYVQRWVAGTNGNLYAPLINKLPRYPIPRWPGRAPSSPGELLLDIGSGWGRWLVSSARKGYTPIGIDIKLDALQAARRVIKAHQLRGYVVAADLQALPFRDCTFDVVFSYSVIQHVHKLRALQCLDEVHRVLHPAGDTLLEFPIQPGLTNWRHKINPSEQDDGDSWCVRYYSQRELTAAFQKVFGNVRITPDCYGGIGVKGEDLDLLPWRYKPVAVLSEFLCRCSRLVTPLQRIADSVYVSSRKNVASNNSTPISISAGDRESNLWILPLLQCPISQKPLILDEQTHTLVAQGSGIRYPIDGEIPILTLEAAQRP